MPLGIGAADPVPVDVLPDLVDWLTAIGTLAAVAVAVGIAFVEARRAAKARQERDTLAETQQREMRRATARLVSAWVERTYEPADDQKTYVPQVMAHIINVSESPVFDLWSSVSLVPPALTQMKPVSLGPLSIPSPMPVLPPRSALSFDLTVPLLPHRQEEQGLAPETPRVEISFTDPNDVRWVRELDGRLVESERSIGELVDSDDQESVDRQVGRLDGTNPLAVVSGYLAILGDEDLDDAAAVQQLRLVIAPEAEGWKGLDSQGVASLRESVTGYGLAGYVTYPAPTIAYVKLTRDAAPENQVVVGEQVPVRVSVVTLTLHPERGWRIFTHGGMGTAPEAIYFPDGVRATPRTPRPFGRFRRRRRGQ